ncbi:MAG TPA: pseudouridine synthase [Bryobacteraceae bacterium]|nr:pseudouridine synthase [Bryobacteraceae bacterium]
MPYRYLLLNKPFNVLCQFTPGAGASVDRRTLADLVAIPDVYPAGRLDFDSEGLVLLTSDGALQHRLTDPKFGHPRTYWVQVEGSPTEEAIRSLGRGIVIQDYRTHPAKARLIDPPDVPVREPPIRYRRQIPTAWLELELKEGRNRQVRRMTAAVGFPTLRLIRSAIGPLTFAGLPVGAWRDLTPAEVAALRAGRRVSAPH